MVIQNEGVKMPIRKPKFQIGDVVWNATYQEFVSIEEIDIRQHGDDDYYVRLWNIDEDLWGEEGYWAEESDLEERNVSEGDSDL